MLLKAAQFTISFLVTTCLVPSSYGFMLAPTRSRYFQPTKTLLQATASEKPEELTEWGMDDDLWETMPGGAVRDLQRFVRTGKLDLAQRRIQSLIEISHFRKGSTVDERTWFQAVDAWEADKNERMARAKEEAKAKRKAEAKAAREAAERAASASADVSAE